MASDVNKLLDFALFYISRGYIVGLIFVIAYVLFGPGVIAAKIIGLSFAFVMSLVAAYYHYRKMIRREAEQERAKEVSDGEAHHWKSDTENRLP